jgi:hypothetical protein
MTNGLRKREYVPVSEAELEQLDQLIDATSFERRILNERIPDAARDLSRAAVLHRVLALGLETLHDWVQDQQYRALAESYTTEELAERRAEQSTRRARLAQSRGTE